MRILLRTAVWESLMMLDRKGKDRKTEHYSLDDGRQKKKKRESLPSVVPPRLIPPSELIGIARPCNPYIVIVNPCRYQLGPRLVPLHNLTALAKCFVAFVNIVQHSRAHHTRHLLRSAAPVVIREAKTRQRPCRSPEDGCRGYRRTLTKIRRSSVPSVMILQSMRDQHWRRRRRAHWCRDNGCSARGMITVDVEDRRAGAFALGSR
jgi:hypothetical protein